MIAAQQVALRLRRRRKGIGPGDEGDDLTALDRGDEAAAVIGERHPPARGRLDQAVGVGEVGPAGLEQPAARLRLDAVPSRL